MYDILIRGGDLIDGTGSARRRADVGIDPRHPGICARCVSNLDGPGEARRHA